MFIDMYMYMIKWIIQSYVYDAMDVKTSAREYKIVHIFFPGRFKACLG